MAHPATFDSHRRPAPFGTPVAVHEKLGTDSSKVQTAVNSPTSSTTPPTVVVVATAVEVVATAVLLTGAEVAAKVALRIGAVVVGASISGPPPQAAARTNTPVTKSLRITGSLQSPDHRAHAHPVSKKCPTRLGSAEVHRFQRGQHLRRTLETIGI